MFEMVEASIVVVAKLGVEVDLEFSRPMWYSREFTRKGLMESRIQVKTISLV